MNHIRLLPPEVSAHDVTFRWLLDPPSTLYQRPWFTLRFPQGVELNRVPADLWWTIALMCLHSHWLLLRPCQVYLPVRLRPGEAECWRRLLDAELVTLETSKGNRDFERTVTIVEDGPPLSPPAPLPDTGRCASAFSGGKDSLAQTGLLTELTERPLLVATTSPLPPLEDHMTSRRRQIFADITRRRDVMLVEVKSDYRANFDNGFARQLGYWISVNELTDTFLYTAALIAAGAALGPTHLFLASEAQVSETTAVNGLTVQHNHFMYSVVTQAVLQALLLPYGIRYGSLISPLHSYQAQTLLWTRYRDLSDLQYSCWRVKRGESVCSRCSQCLRIALCALALGGRPARMGIDWVKLLNEMRDWTPRSLADIKGPLLPNDLSAIQLSQQVVRDIRTVSLSRMIWTIARDTPQKLLTRPGREALTAWRALRRRALAADPGPPPGYRPGYLAFLDPLLRDRVAKVYAEHFSPADKAEYADTLNRTEQLIDWIVEPLAQGPALQQ